MCAYEGYLLMVEVLNGDVFMEANYCYIFEEKWDRTTIWDRTIDTQRNQCVNLAMSTFT